MTLPPPPHSMCITVRVDAAMLTELLAEVGNESLSKILNNTVKLSLQTVIKEAHIEFVPDSDIKAVLNSILKDAK